MNRLLVILLLLVPASSFAAPVDSCYLFQRNSENWQRCKEDLAEAQARWDKLEQGTKEIVREMNEDARVSRHNYNNQQLIREIERLKAFQAE